MSIASDARESRAAMRSAYILARCDDLDPELREAIFDALERSHEAYMNRVEEFAKWVQMILSDQTVRIAVLRAAATFTDPEKLVKSPAPLRLVETVYDGTDVA